MDVVLMNPTATQSASAPFHLDQFLVEVADIVNTTLDLDALLQRTAEMVRRVIDYEIFAILLLNDKKTMGKYTNSLWENTVNATIVAGIIVTSTLYAVSAIFPNWLH